MYLVRGNFVKRILLSLLIIIIAFVLQLTVIPIYPIFGVKADILLVVVIILSLMVKNRETIFIALLAGLLKEAFFGGIFAVNLLGIMLVVALVDLIGGNFFKKNYLIPPLITGLFTILHEIFLYLFIYRTVNMQFLKALTDTILPEAILNSILAFIIYIILFKILYSSEEYY